MEQKINSISKERNGSIVKKKGYNQDQNPEGQNQNSVAPCLVPGNLCSKGLDGYASPALLPAKDPFLGSFTFTIWSCTWSMSHSSEIFNIQGSPLKLMI